MRADHHILCIAVRVCVLACDKFGVFPSQSGHSEYYMWPAGAMGRGNEGLLEGERERLAEQIDRKKRQRHLKLGAM